MQLSAELETDVKRHEAGCVLGRLSGLGWCVQVYVVWVWVWGYQLATQIESNSQVDSKKPRLTMKPPGTSLDSRCQEKSFENEGWLLQSALLKSSGCWFLRPENLLQLLGVCSQAWEEYSWAWGLIAQWISFGWVGLRATQGDQENKRSSHERIFGPRKKGNRPGIKEASQSSKQPPRPKFPITFWEWLKNLSYLLGCMTRSLL